MSHKFFCNKECEYFPCHKTDNPEEFNCMFCYCPLYMLGEECGGNFTYLANGVKDCSACILPHIKEKGYKHVQKKMREAIEKGKRKGKESNALDKTDKCFKCEETEKINFTDLQPAQIEMLKMSDSDIANGRLISDEESNKQDEKWLY